MSLFRPAALAVALATALSAGELNVVELKGDARLSYVRSTEILKPTGIPLEMSATFPAWPTS